jgi:hypothetical protein
MPLRAEIVDEEIDKKEIIQEYDNGVVAERRVGRRTYLFGGHRRTSHDSWEIVIDAEGNELDPYPREPKHSCVELLSRCGGSISRVDNPYLIPIEVARLDKPAIAMYLRLFSKLSSREIGELLQIKRESVLQYLTDFRYGRR